jgi:signal transduction histidine kinase
VPRRLRGAPDSPSGADLISLHHDAPAANNGTKPEAASVRRTVSGRNPDAPSPRTFRLIEEERLALAQLRDAHDRLRLAVESSDIGTFDFSPITGGMVWSERCKAIFGLAPNAPVTYEVFLGCLHPDDRARAEATVARALAADGPDNFDVEYRVRWRDGMSRAVIVKGRVFFEEEGKARRAVRLIGTAIDVTERRRAESYARLLAESSTLLASSFDTEVMLAGVARLAVQHFAAFVFFDMLDDGGAIMRSAAVHRDGTRAEQMQRAKEFKADLSRWPLDNPIAAALREQRVVMSQQPSEGGGQVALDEAHRALMQSLDAVSLIVVPLIARGRAIGVVTFARCSVHPPFGNAEREIAEELARRTATAIDNAQLYRAAVAANDAKSTFLASMSHELRTPLTAIIGYEELLADGITGPVTDPQRQQLGRIKASATHLLGLIDEILTYSRVEAGSERAQMEVVEIRMVLEDAAALVAPLVDDRGLVLVVELPDGPLSVCTDVQKLRQILVNLLSNATKFTEHGGITLSASRSRRQMLFHVRDTGIGIPQQHLQQIFEPFWQVDQRANRRVGGTGLGLTVSRRLAQLIGGDLSVESDVGGGSTFTLQIPALD